MQQKVFVCLLFVIISVNCHIIAHDSVTRAKRSAEEGFFSKAKSGIIGFGSDIKRVTVKGYEEVKNLFSSDRKVGDYVADKIDVRFGESGEEEKENELQELGSNSTVVEASTEAVVIPTEATDTERVKRNIMDVEREIKEEGVSDTATEGENIL
jgi:hypothetical protein